MTPRRGRRQVATLLAALATAVVTAGRTDAALPRIVPSLATPEPVRTPAFDDGTDAALPVATPSSAPGARPLYLIVPFGDPDDTSPIYRNATQALSRDLSDRRLRSAVTTPVDQLEAVGSAPRLCAEYRAASLLMGELLFEQQHERNLTGFIPVIGGIVSSSGVFDASPIRARVRLYQVDCHGRVMWKTTTLANKVHHGQNVDAGLTQIALQAINAAAEEFLIRPGG